MSNFFTIKKPTEHMKKLCKELGPDYSITAIDLERVIYRDFGNGYDVEISCMNTTSTRKKARIYLWRDQDRIIKTLKDVPQSRIGEQVEHLHTMVLTGLRSAGR